MKNSNTNKALGKAFASFVELVALKGLHPTSGGLMLTAGHAWMIARQGEAILGFIAFPEPKGQDGRFRVECPVTIYPEPVSIAEFIIDTQKSWGVDPTTCFADVVTGNAEDYPELYEPFMAMTGGMGALSKLGTKPNPHN